MYSTRIPYVCVCVFISAFITLYTYFSFCVGAIKFQLAAHMLSSILLLLLSYDVSQANTQLHTHHTRERLNTHYIYIIIINCRQCVTAGLHCLSGILYLCQLRWISRKFCHVFVFVFVSINIFKCGAMFAS